MTFRRSAIAFIAIALLASGAFALDIPPKPTQWVNDYGANVLSASQIQDLNVKLESFYKATGVQFLVMIFPSLEGEDDLGYTNKVANIWKVKDDKALMLFVFMKERKTRIQVGYSMEPVITDAFASDIVHATIPPFFRAGDYAGGLNAAVDQMAKKIDPNISLPAGGSSPQPVQQAPEQDSSYVVNWFAIAIFVVFLILRIVSSRRRGRRGGGCFWPMFFGGWGGGGTTIGGGGGGFSTGGSWGGGGSSFGGGGAGGGW